MRHHRTLPVMLGSLALSVLLVAPAGAAVRGGADAPPSSPGSASGSATAPPTGPTTGPCAYTPVQDTTYSTLVGLPPDPRRTPDRGTVKVDLRTNRGSIGLRLDRSAAPCTVQSFLFLTRQRYFDHTVCHRLTTYPTLSVLQCGDPLGTGEGDPGYSVKDELPTDLAPAPNDPSGLSKIYPRGTLAMANAGPATNGSQFFLVYKDSSLRPDYTVFGRVTERGMRVLDAIAAGGVAPGSDQQTDGAPALRIEITRATVVSHHHHHHGGGGHGHGRPLGHR